MNKHIPLLFLILCSLAVAAQTSAKKYVFIEHFTNTKCSICASKNPAFYNLIDDYPDDIHHVSIHPPIPYVTCAFYLANPAENSAWANTYDDIDGTPRVALNGTLIPVGSPLLPATTLQTYLNQTSPLWLQVMEDGAGNGRTATVKAHSLGAIPAGGYKLYAAVVEKTVTAPPPPNNGEQIHHDVFRKMLTDVNGEVFTPATAGQSVEFNFDYTVNANWNVNEIYVVAWVKDTASNEVLNSGTQFDPPPVSGTNDPSVHTIPILPNPANDVALARIGDDRAQLLEVFAANGRRISLSAEIQEVGTVNIPLATLSAGIYFVKITGEKGVYVGKVVKQ